MAPSKLDRTSLVKLSKSFGLKLSGKKDALSARIINHLNLIEHQPLPKKIVAIDVGQVNLAYIYMNVKYFKDLSSEKTIVDWKLLNPGFSKEYNPENDILCCRELLDEGLYKQEADLYIIERQSIRPLGKSRLIPTSIQRSNQIEALLFATIFERGRLANLPVYSVQPRAVSDHFGLSSIGSTDRAKLYKSKKENAIKLTSSLLDKGTIKCNQHIVEYFQSSPKKDDLCDSLLSVLAYLDWFTTAKRYQRDNK